MLHHRLSGRAEGCIWQRWPRSAPARTGKVHDGVWQSPHRDPRPSQRRHWRASARSVTLLAQPRMSSLRAPSMGSPGCVSLRRHSCGRSLLPARARTPYAKERRVLLVRAEDNKPEYRCGPQYDTIGGCAGGSISTCSRHLCRWGCSVPTGEEGGGRGVAGVCKGQSQVAHTGRIS